MKHTRIILGLITLIIFAGGLYLLIPRSKEVAVQMDLKDAEYTIEGARIRLVDGVAETEAAPGSASKIVTRYFGNEVRDDLNDDGRMDTVFLLTQDRGGSGTFFYAVAALDTEAGIVGSHGYFLGDRIAPQTTETSRDPGHVHVIVVNYADRAAGEPMVARPSVGKSVWLKLDPATMQFGEVVQNFEGEADPGRMTLTMQSWTWVRALYNDGRVIAPKQPGKFTLTFSEGGRFSATTDCNRMGGAYAVEPDGKIAFSDIVSTQMFCEGSQEGEFATLLQNIQTYHFTSKGELILGIKFDSGTVLFK